MIVEEKQETHLIIHLMIQEKDKEKCSTYNSGYLELYK